MIPVTQTKLHDPPRQNGNCLAAALASILELPIEAIPEFEDMKKSEWWDELKSWLKIRGMYIINFDGENIQFLLDNFDMYFIVSGTSPRGDCNHSVIYKGNKMVHDPHPSGNGVTEIKEVDVIVPVDPSNIIDNTIY